MKAIVTNFYIREINGDASQILNARQEIARGNSAYGVNWKFEEVNKEKFLNEIELDTMVCCVKTKSNKYVEVDKNNIDKFNI